MKIAYIDCFAGASGDMLLGALLASGVDPKGLATELAKLNLKLTFRFVLGVPDPFYHNYALNLANQYCKHSLLITLNPRTVGNPITLIAQNMNALSEKRSRRLSKRTSLDIWSLSWSK